MPLISNNDNLFDITEITEVLREENLINSSSIAQSFRNGPSSGNNQVSEEKVTEIRRILNRNGGSVQEASSVITDVMHNSKFDNTRIKAAEIVLDLHEIRNKEGKINSQPIINFNILSDQVNIQNIFDPHRNTYSNSNTNGSNNSFDETNED